MSKEMWIDAHMEIVAERMAEWEEKNPDATKAEYDAEEARVYDTSGEAAQDRYADNIGNLIDAARDRKKYEGV
jgi:hypothetical protein